MIPLKLIITSILYGISSLLLAHGTSWRRLKWAAHAKVGLGGYALLITLSVALGVCCAWMMDTIGYIVYGSVRQKSEAVQEWAAGATFSAALIWIFFAIFLGEWLLSIVLWLVF